MIPVSYRYGGFQPVYHTGIPDPAGMPPLLPASSGPVINRLRVGQCRALDSGCYSDSELSLRFVTASDSSGTPVAANLKVRAR
jgi:hypothetical protein